MSCCNKTYETIINNTPVILEEVSSGCYVSRFKNPVTKVGVRKKKNINSCCEQIDLSKFKKKFEWFDGVCLDGIITYDRIRLTSKELDLYFDIPDNITAQALVELLAEYNLTLQRAIELISTRVSSSDENCKENYCNVEITVPVSTICPPGFISNFSEITVPACQFTSVISVADANQQALIYIDQIKQDYISNNITCTGVTRFCNEEVSGTFLKPNCPINTIPQLVTTTIEAGTLCGYASQEIANLAALNLLNSQLEINALGASSTVYCLVDLPVISGAQVFWYAVFGPDPNTPGSVLLTEQGTGVTMSPLDLALFSIGTLVSIKYRNLSNQTVVKTGAITSIQLGAIRIKDLLLDDIISLQQQTVLSQGLLKSLNNNRIYDIGITPSTSLLPF